MRERDGPERRAMLRITYRCCPCESMNTAGSFAAAPLAPLAPRLSASLAVRLIVVVRVVVVEPVLELVVLGRKETLYVAGVAERLASNRGPGGRGGVSTAGMVIAG